MSIFNDMQQMHQKYAVDKWVTENPEKLKEFLEFRIAFLDEELCETKAALRAGDTDEIVDGLIDLIVVAAGTLDCFGIDGQKAWDEVHNANMSKEVGVKPSRPNPFGLPDLIKPVGWKAPSHIGNTGILNKVISKVHNKVVKD